MIERSAQTQHTRWLKKRNGQKQHSLRLAAERAEALQKERDALLAEIQALRAERERPPAERCVPPRRPCRARIRARALTDPRPRSPPTEQRRPRTPRGRILTPTPTRSEIRCRPARPACASRRVPPLAHANLSDRSIVDSGTSQVRPRREARAASLRRQATWLASQPHPPCSTRLRTLSSPVLAPAHTMYVWHRLCSASDRAQPLIGAPAAPTSLPASRSRHRFIRNLDLDGAPRPEPSRQLLGSPELSAGPLADQVAFPSFVRSSR